MARYPEDIKQFIADNVEGMYVHDLVEKINSTFGTDYTYNQIRNYKKNHNLKSCVPTNSCKGSTLFEKEIEQFIVDNITGISVKELTEKVNTSFGTMYSVGQIRSYKSRNGLKNGMDAQFKKGSIPHNKGVKGVHAPGSEKGWFKKGDMPINHKPVGSERVDKDGYTLIKVAEPRTWKHKHRVIWEQHHGPIPKDHVVIFLDGDKQNLDINNLALITRNELKIMNNQSLRSEDADITETGVLIARLISTKDKCKKKAIK